jgi:NADPH:quinone reductase-like Zn-dependent oxidoreductase
MRAIVMHETGPPGVLKLEDVERPEPIPTEVLVKAAAAGVNPVDYKTREKGGFLASLGGFPAILGWDVAGTVDEVAPGGTTRFQAGDRVFGMPWFPRRASCYAEYVTSPSRQLARTPEKLSDEQAAALPLAGLTAWQSLVDTAGVGDGDRVLIHAAAGGVGHLAVQIAKARGAYVIGTASAAKHEFLTDLGCDEAIDYEGRAFEDAVDGVDVVLDLVGTEDYGLRSLRTLHEDGLLIAVPRDLDDSVRRAAAEQGKRATDILVEPDGAALEQLAALVESDRLRVFVEESFPLEEAAEAHERLQYGKARGKYVLTL